ncbi:MAG: hypothetical protein EHM70_08255 [Chloroflexota bacterium]|nr:MAG: hypothetical protein EHM70_08255 [Chloroflexota bacterium]
MKIGYAQTAITPCLDKPVFLAGFGNNRRAETIHDDLYARALAIEDGSTTLVLAALDLLGFIRADVNDVIQEVHKTHPNAQVIIASIHTHHAPDTLGLWGPDRMTNGVDGEYLSATKDKIASTILASLSYLQKATIRSTSVHIPGLVKNTRNPEILDDELTVVQFLAADGKPAATLFNFPCHPEVLWEHNPHITADYVAPLRQEVEKQTGAACIFFAGALGGMLTPDVKDHSFAEAEFMGRKLAQEGLKAIGAASIDPAPTSSIQRKEIKARLTNILYKMAFEQKLLQDVRDPEGFATSEVNLIKLGGLWLATVPGELLPKLGLQLKAWMKTAGAQVASVIGLANDELGYMLPAEDFKYPSNPFNPGKHYEETNSIGKDIAPKVMDALSEIIHGRAS